MSDRHVFHLRQFLSIDESQLPSLLVPVEELDGNEGFTVGDYSESPLAGFHPEADRMVVRDDDHYLGCRAGHFLLAFGRTEALWNDRGWADCVVCQANHKGGLRITVYGFNDDMEVGQCVT
jgi:hypothetical protein